MAGILRIITAVLHGTQWISSYLEGDFIPQHNQGTRRALQHDLKHLDV